MVGSSHCLLLFGGIVANRNLSEIEVKGELRLQIIAQLIGDDRILTLLQKHEAIVQNLLQLFEFLIVEWRGESFEQNLLLVEGLGIIYLKMQNLQIRR